MPISVLKQLANDVAPFLTALFNRSIAEGVVPAVFKLAFITPRLKNPDMDATGVRSFRLISNLSVISKLLERLDRCSSPAEVPDSEQSVTTVPVSLSTTSFVETAVVKVLSDLLLAIDKGNLACLSLLDLSAAFDTVDHDVLLQR